MTRLLVVTATLLALAGGAGAAKKAPERYLFEVQSISATEKAPAEVSVKAKAILAELLATRPEFVARLDGAPDPASAPHEYVKFLETNHVRAFSVTIKVDRWERTLAPGDKPDTGQVLTIKLGVSLVGAQIPGGALALAGSGQSTVMANVGLRVRPGEEESALDDALRDALTHAVDDAVHRLRMPPPKKKK
jgi:hypothetical protein